MGAPGTKAFTGSVIAYNTSTRVTATYIDDGTVQFGSYLGKIGRASCRERV